MDNIIGCSWGFCWRALMAIVDTCSQPATPHNIMLNYCSQQIWAESQAALEEMKCQPLRQKTRVNRRQTDKDARWTQPLKRQTAFLFRAINSDGGDFQCPADDHQILSLLTDHPLKDIHNSHPSISKWSLVNAMFNNETERQLLQIKCPLVVKCWQLLTPGALFEWSSDTSACRVPGPSSGQWPK